MALDYIEWLPEADRPRAAWLKKRGAESEAHRFILGQSFVEVSPVKMRDSALGDYPRICIQFVGPTDYSTNLVHYAWDLAVGCGIRVGSLVRVRFVLDGVVTEVTLAMPAPTHIHTHYYPGAPPSPALIADPCCPEAWVVELGDIARAATDGWVARLKAGRPS